MKSEFSSGLTSRSLNKDRNYGSQINHRKLFGGRELKENLVKTCKDQNACPASKGPQAPHGELTNRLKEGSFQTMCEVVRDLTASDWQMPLGVTTKAMLRKVQQRLYQEWATAADISVAEATKEIDTLLQASQEAALK
jgi:RNA polymerase-interacting CarD/CdnL/TRCF family regulator